jgi:predicted acetyltransferase
MLWIRVLDVPRALSSRSYAVDGRLALEVRDPFRPECGGRFVLDGGPDGASCVRDDTAEPDLSLTATDLGALYLGGVGVAPLVATGRIAARDTSVVRRASAMLRVDPAPHCHTDF